MNMCIYLCKHTHIAYIYIYVIYTHIFAYICITGPRWRLPYTSIYIYIYMYICIYIYTYICVYVYICAGVHICTYVFMYIHVYIYIYTHIYGSVYAYVWFSTRTSWKGGFEPRYDTEKEIHI